MTGRVSVHSRCAWLLAVPRQRVRQLLSAMLACSPCPWQHVELHIVRDGAMAAYNSQHLGCTGPTNILSFPACASPPCVDTPHEAPALQDDTAALILSVDTAHREAFLYGQVPEDYIVWLLAHGMGHVMGYDHGEAMDALCSRLYKAARNC